MSASEKRKQSLITYLMKKKQYVAAHEISKSLDISNKTVYRMINEINDGSPQKNIIVSQYGKGYLLNYSEYIKHRIASKAEGESIYTPLERRNAITKTLLFKSPRSVSIMTFCETFYVSESVINSDEKIIADMLKPFHLEVVRVNRKISVIGNENDIRNAIAQLLLNEIPLETNEFYANEEAINQEYMSFAMKQIDYIEQAQNSSIPYPYNLNITSHLYIMIKRLMQGDINIGYSIDQYSINDQQLIKANNELYELSQKIIDHIRFRFSIQIPNSEVFYLFQYLISSRIDSNCVEEIRYSPLVFEVTHFYISQVLQKLDVQTTGSEEILKDMIKHIQPMLNRINHHIQIKNHLLEEIEQEYGDILAAVIDASTEVERTFDFNPISKEESGFITLYFAKYLETNPRRMNALIMCTTGIGTSELLRTKVTKAFPEVEIIDVISTRMLENYDTRDNNIDLIITTVHVDSHSNTPQILVSALFTENDQERVRSVIRSLV
ncbi:BglG family transcription antiterminator [Domibacillus enclensis]|uniref:Transcriptional antiterminator, BglG family n=1 Tax=Domibacillus enclensis TaxID=1017273 RepID=A0A1N6XSH6_9BACI|nr:PRD domain-containing protein [Domibacillus enclensis]OXS77415.1 hypothetical protein B1B05_11270 [Domibacillus enclensis]SIR05179.1 transcriptional antiterminator, BglG family [Domibacillus enclensis]